MAKRFLFVSASAVAALAIALLYRHRRAGLFSSTNARVQIAVAHRPISSSPTSESHSTRISSADTFEDRILNLVRQHRSPAEVAALLKKLYADDPQRLFEALSAIGNSPLETRRDILPVLANALTLWPEAEGRYIFPIADAYGETSLPDAAEWAADFLVKTGRTDLAASTLVARLAETSEARALVLIAALPETARSGAAQALAYHVRLDDLDHLYGMCSSFDAQSNASFSKVLFERLGMEKLQDTALWLSNTPEAQSLPGAVSAIARAMVRFGDPKAAINWADALSASMPRAQAISSVYQQWSESNPDSAIEDILSAYDGAPTLMADVFKGAAAHHGSDPSSFWETASKLQNPSARAYALSALIEPVLLTQGQAATQAKIEALAPGSLERNVAEMVLQNALKKPAVAFQLENRGGPTAGTASQGS